MVLKNLNSYFRGWVAGDFEPSLIKSNELEVAIKRYKATETEPKHYHKEAIEYTIVIDGVIKMNDVIYKKDDIIEVSKMEIVKFECIEDATTVVIKSPYVKNDKYLI